jgi:hypothetical protein
LPKASHDFLKKYFSYTSVDIVKKNSEYGGKGYEVRLKNGTEVEFWKDGSHREVDGCKNYAYGKLLILIMGTKISM